MQERFSAQVVLVAGGTGGLNRAVSLTFLEAGAAVAVTYRHAVEFEALQATAVAHSPAWKATRWM